MGALVGARSSGKAATKAAATHTGHCSCIDVHCYLL
jgi:hypothetical protein